MHAWLTLPAVVVVVSLQVGMHAEAAKAAVRVTDPNLTQHVNNLLAVIAFEQDNLPGRL